MRKIILAGCILILAACTAVPSPIPQPLTATTGNTPTDVLIFATVTPGSNATSSATPGALPSATITTSPTPLLTPPPNGPQLCSPLQDIAITELASILTTPFTAASPGQDNGHQGADFAYYHRGSHTVMLGLPVYSSLAGKVAAIILNRPPYGNAIIIETPISNISPILVASLNLHLQSTLAVSEGRLICPTPAVQPAWMPDSSSTYPAYPVSYSLYLMYAHLNKAPLVKVGDAVTCGQPIGEVGTTGNSINPHLHLETRLGPAGGTFTSLSHYINNATNEEMSNYCTWRISWLFQAFDPLKLFTLPNR